MQLAAQVKSAPYIEAKIDVVCASLQVLGGPQLPRLLVFYSAGHCIASGRAGRGRQLLDEEHRRAS